MKTIDSLLAELQERDCEIEQLREALRKETARGLIAHAWLRNERLTWEEGLALATKVLNQQGLLP